MLFQGLRTFLKEFEAKNLILGIINVEGVLILERLYLILSDMTKKLMKNLIPLFLVGLVFLVGCGKKAPDGFPKTYSTTVKITLDGKPFQNASISFHPESGSNRWSVAGRTDSNGNAAMTTFQGDYRANGAPEGSYKLTVGKEAIYPDWNEEKIEVKSAADALAAKAQSQRKKKTAVHEIPTELANVKQSNTVVEVTASGGVFQYEVNDLVANLKPAPKGR